MKPFTLAILGICLLVFSGCYTAPRSAFVPPVGILFTDYKAPLLVKYDDAAVSRNSGDAAASFGRVPLIAGGAISFAWDDCSLATAAKNGRFNRIGSADYEFFNVLGVYAKTTVRVYNVPKVEN